MMIIKISGIICLVTYALLFIKLFTRLAGLKKPDALVMKMHEAVSGTFFLSMLLHAVLNFVHFQQDKAALYIFGAAAAVSAAALITLCHMMKNPSQRYKVHLYMTILTLALICGHIVLQRV